MTGNSSRVRPGTPGNVPKIVIFLEMIKFEHSVFALPFAYLGLFFAERGWPRPEIFFWVTVAMGSFRTMAMGANRLIDASLDALNPRTQNRALPAGRLKSSFVWFMVLAGPALFEFSAYRLNPLCFKLSPIPVILAWLYPWMKRFTWLSHLLLGIILGIAPYGAWLANRSEFSWIPGFLTAGIAAWVAGFDILYALQDLEVDRKIGLYSFPTRFGFETSLVAARILHALTLLLWFAAGYLGGFGLFYFAGLAMVGFFFIREHWLIRRFGLAKIEQVFFTMNAFVSLGFFMTSVLDIFLRGRSA